MATIFRTSREHVQAHTRQTPTGRKPLPDKLPRVEIEVLPPEVQQEGLAAFEKIGLPITLHTAFREIPSARL